MAWFPVPRRWVRLLLPAVVLTAAVFVAWAVRPRPPLMFLLVAVIVFGTTKSFRRTETWHVADDITTLRLGLMVVFTALIFGNVGFSWPAVIVAGTALALDACDGYVARRTTSTRAGADYDEAVDALAVLILAAALVPVWGWWALLPGTFYYIFTAICLIRPAWKHKLPPSKLRKSIAAAQGVLLLTAGSPLALRYEWLGITCVALALATLTFSFARDVMWLMRAVGARAVPTLVP